VSVPLAGNGTDAASTRALGTLAPRPLARDRSGKVPGISYAVGGETAGSHDFDAQLAATAPWCSAFVLGRRSCC